MEIPLRTAYGQNGRCGMQPKAKHSLRAQAQLIRTETVETVELVKVKQKLFRERKREAAKENARVAGVYRTPCASDRGLNIRSQIATSGSGAEVEGAASSNVVLVT
ncbi:hypothetical protein TNCV_2522821 [Trichonephila clavipes]|nr:hypothetical protein TNCV_2522821 [Trichonephila clavipes]